MKVTLDYCYVEKHHGFTGREVPTFNKLFIMVIYSFKSCFFTYKNRENNAMVFIFISFNNVFEGALKFMALYIMLQM